MISSAPESRDAASSSALAELATEYVQRYAQLASALQKAGGPLAAELLREQIAACARLRAERGKLATAIESARLEIDLRQRQAARLEGLLRARHDELEELRQLLERQTAWANEREGAAQLLVSERNTEPATRDEPDDPHLLELQQTRALLRDWLRVTRSSSNGHSVLEAQLREIGLRCQELQTDHDELLGEPSYAEAKLNVEALGLRLAEAEAGPVISQLEAATAALLPQAKATRQQITELDGELHAVRADELARATAVRWLEGELAGEGIWRRLVVRQPDQQDDAALAISAEALRVVQLTRELRELEQAAVADQSELLGRQRQLWWLQGELEARERWSQLTAEKSDQEVHP